MNKNILCLVFILSQVAVFANRFEISSNDGLAVPENIVFTVTPTFSFFTFLCKNSAPPALPTVSNNGIGGSWSPSVVDTSVEGTFSYTFTPDSGQDAIPVIVHISVYPATSANQVSGPMNSTAFVCEGEPMQPIIYEISAGASVSFATNSNAITGGFVNGLFTVSGNPTQTAGYTLTVSGLCGTVTKTKGIHVLSLDLTAGNQNMSLCRDDAVTAGMISYNVGTWSFNYNMSVTGLPPGLSAIPEEGFATGIRIVGTPTTDGVYNYTLTIQSLDESCTKTATGTLTVVGGPTVVLTSGQSTTVQSVCLGVPIVPIKYSIGNAGTVTGGPFPEGISGNLANGIYIISGTPTNSGQIFYTLTVSNIAGTCNVTKGGYINVDGPSTTLALASGNQYQNVCLGIMNTPVVFHADNATLIQLTGSPYLSYTYDPVTNNLTINPSLLPTGNYNYTITASGGGCVNATKTGYIIVRNQQTALHCELDDNGLIFKWYIGPEAGGGYNFSYTVDDSAPVTGFLPSSATSGIMSHSIPLVLGQSVTFNIMPQNISQCYGPDSSTCVYDILGNEDISLAATRIYPNPVVNWLTFDSPVVIEKVEIYNLLGQRIYDKTLRQSRFEIDFSSFLKGIYVVQIVSDGKSKALRVIKE